MRVALRADVSAQVGTGHLMRCLTLANILRSEGAHCEFLTAPTSLESLITQAGHRHAVLPEQPLSEIDDAAACQKLLSGKADWIVVDHYRLSAIWQREMRQSTKKILAVDDIADRPHAADLLLDQNELPDKELRYQHLLSDGCRSLFGSRYALLRPEFHSQPAQVRNRGLQRLLVSYGGSDPANLTAAALDALDASGWGQRPVDVVIGALHPAGADLAARCALHPTWTLHRQAENMAALMDASDLALGGSGSSLWERCARGLPSILSTLAANQEPLAAIAANTAAALWPHPDQPARFDTLPALLASLEACPHTLSAMSRAALSLCDGRGAARVAACLLVDGIQLRPALPSDESLTFIWRNHPAVRRHSGDGREISIEQHRHWFRSVLSDPQRQILIAEINCKPVAILRFDGLEGDQPEISIYLDPARIGLGWGRPALDAAARWLRETRSPVRIRARIHPDNHSSRRAFRDAGYLPETHWWNLCL